MAVIYGPAVKTARMEAVRALLNGGYLELLGGNTRLAMIRLPTPCGMVEGPTLTCALTEGTFADAKGHATAARLLSSSGEPVVTGLTVGKTGDVRLDSQEIDKGQIITINSISLTHA